MNLLTLMSIDGVGAIRRYDISQDKPLLVMSSAVQASYPRGIDIAGSDIYVADTFGHRVIRMDYNSLDLLGEAPSYYPNSVQIVRDRLIVAEEHRNIVANFQLRTLARLEPFAGCPTYALEAELLNIPRGSICDGKNNIVELYSPNDAFSIDEYVYIADTDNHRVIALYGGQVIGQVIGFNNPINVRAVRR